MEMIVMMTEMRITGMKMIGMRMITGMKMMTGMMMMSIQKRKKRTVIMMALLFVKPTFGNDWFLP